MDKSRRYVWAAVAVMLVVAGTATSTAAARSVARSDADKARRSFAASSAEVASTLRLAIQHEEDLVVSASAFLAGNPHASSAEFRAWAASVRASQRYPELRGLNIGAFVQRSQLAAYAALQEADPSGPLGPDGRFTAIPPGDRPYYCFQQAVGYSTPGLPVVPAGVDYCADSNLAPAFVASRDSGLGAYFPADLGTHTYLLSYAPVYSGGGTPTTVEGRRAAFLAWMATGVEPKVLVDRALVGHSGMQAVLRYRDASTNAAFAAGRAVRGGQRATTDLANGWSVLVTGASVVNGIGANGGALGLLVAGIGGSVLIGALVLTLATGRARALRVVRQKTEELRHMALHDTLTGLPNRALINDRLAALMARSRRHGLDGAVLFVDLDGFKQINDTLGHEAGDQLLVAMAERLTAGLRDTDTIGRLGGDEFVVLVDGGPDGAGPEAVAQRLLELLREPFVLEAAPAPLEITTSVGVAIGDRDTGEELLRDADAALYEAKAAGKNRYAVHGAGGRLIRAVPA